MSSLRWPALQSPWIWTACRCPQSSCHVTTQMVSSLSLTHAASTSLVISLRLVTGDGDQSVISCFSVSCKHATFILLACVSLIYCSGTEKQPSSERGLYSTTSHIPNLFVQILIRSLPVFSSVICCQCRLNTFSWLCKKSIINVLRVVSCWSICCSNREVLSFGLFYISAIIQWKSTPPAQDKTSSCSNTSSLLFLIGLWNIYWKCSDSLSVAS